MILDIERKARSLAQHDYMVQGVKENPYEVDSVEWKAYESEIHQLELREDLCHE